VLIRDDGLVLTIGYLIVEAEQVWLTTGTLTRALPVRPGETWTAAFDGVPLEGIAVRFA